MRIHGLMVLPNMNIVTIFGVNMLLYFSCKLIGQAFEKFVVYGQYLTVATLCVRQHSIGQSWLARI